MPTQRQIQMARTEVSLRVSSCVCVLVPSLSTAAIECAAVRRESDCLELN